jgi:Tfp pilus assembly protein PilF
LIFLDNGQDRETLVQFEAALAIDPSHEEARRALQEIQQRRD